MNQKQEFNDFIQRHIKDYLPTKFIDAKISIHNIIKGNDDRETALIISNYNGEGIPTIYLDQYYEQYKNGRSIDEILKEMAYLRVDQDDLIQFNSNDFLDYNYAKSRLTLRLYDKDNNANYLKDKPYTSIGDWVVTYRVQPLTTQNTIATFAVTNDLLKIYNISKEQLHNDAIEAEKNRQGVVLYDVMEFMTGKYKNLFNEIKPLRNPKPIMYYLSNESKLNGAAVIAIDGVLDKIGFLIDSNYYILPASINDLLIYPDRGSKRVKELIEIVKSANETTLEPNELLSYKIQYYNRKLKRLESVNF